MSDLLFTADKSATKVFKSGTGTTTVADSTGTTKYTTVTIPHGYPTEDLLVQVFFTYSVGGVTYTGNTPFSSNSAAFNAIANIDATNLYITFGTYNKGASTWQYSYRLLIP